MFSLKSIEPYLELNFQPMRALGSNPTQPRVRRNNGASRFHPTINRWTGRPHEHKQEIARRLRQRGIEMPLPIPEPVKAPRRRKAAAAK